MALIRKTSDKVKNGLHDDVHVFFDLVLVKFPADEPLGGVERVCGVGHGLSLCGHSDQPLAV